MRLFLKFALLAVAFATPALAHADAFTFTTPTGTLQFKIPSSPTNIVDHNGYFEVDGVSYTGTLGTGTATFFFNNVGDIAYNNGLGQPYGFHLDPPNFSGVMFTGSSAAPTFVTGTYNLQYAAYYGAPYSGPATLTIASTPEPSSFLLIGTGIFGVAATVRRRILS